MTKEELRKEFIHFLYFEWEFDDVQTITDKETDELFSWFWRRLEEKKELLKAADEIICIYIGLDNGFGKVSDLKEYLEKYNSLKSNP